MQKYTLVMLSLLAGLYGAQAIAAETAAVAATESSTVAKKPAVKKKACVGQDGKPCPPKAKKQAKQAAADVQGAQAAMKPLNAPVSAASGVAAALTSTIPSKVNVVVPPVVPDVPVVSAAEAIKLAVKSGCSNCHKLEGAAWSGSYGPKWNEVAKHYRGDAKAEAFLVNKIARGGTGVWGKNMMPANSPRVSDADIRTLAKFVLNLQ